MSRSLYDKLYRLYGDTLPESTVSARASALVDLDQQSWNPSPTPDCLAKLGTIRVAIVGGGFAGMMAAWSLCQAYIGIEVVVFEAGADVGGRVLSDEKFTKGTRTTEFGAELVGANHPTWIKLARDLGVGLITRTGEGHYKLLKLKVKLRFDGSAGKDLSDTEAQTLEEGMRAAFKEIGKDAKMINDASRPWKQPDLEKFDKVSVQEKLGTLKLTKLVYRGIQMQLENNMVSSIESINYLALLCLVRAGRFGSEKDDPNYLGFWQQTEAFRCADGCQTLVKKMVERLTDPKSKYKFTLLTNTHVRKIETDSATAPKQVKLEWKSTAAVKKVAAGFDYVVLAVPPSVWSDIKITPQHPKDIGPIQMGPASKFFSNFDKRFWILEGAAPSGISSDLGMIWESTDNQMQVGKSQVALAVFAGGPGVAGRDKGYYRNKMRSLYTGYAANLSVNGPELVEWQRRDYIKTGYSCPQKGHIFKVPAVAPALQNPFGGGRMFLAGEHTQTDFFGFMEGALRSGRRAAKDIITTVCPGSFPDIRIA